MVTDINGIRKCCETCDYCRGGYCEAPYNNPDCDWIGEIFHGKYNAWLGWKLRPSVLERHNNMKKNKGEVHLHVHIHT